MNIFTKIKRIVILIKTNLAPLKAALLPKTYARTTIAPNTKNEWIDKSENGSDLGTRKCIPVRIMIAMTDIPANDSQNFRADMPCLLMLY